MIEVEKKCLANEQFLDFLKNNAEKVGDRVLEDIYLDFADFRLIDNDIWLRKRNEKFELKIPISDHTKSDVYEEIEDEREILKRLGIGDFSSLDEVVRLVTHRQKFHIGDFHIDLDEITAPGSEFLYNMMEIELMVESASQYEEAQKRIFEFMQEHSLKNEVVNGKVIEYMRQFRPSLFDRIKRNPRHAHRIVG